MKKISIFVLSLVCVLGIGLSAFAQVRTGSSNQQINITSNPVGVQVVNTAGQIGGISCVGNPADFKAFIQCKIINNILGPLVPLLVSLAVVLFIWGVIKFIFSEGGEKKEEGKTFMFWGVIGLFVMVSLWGLVAIFQSTFNLNPDQINFQDYINVPK
ncbi:MAG: hypothetical protein WCO10_03755 [bacterium]